MWADLILDPPCGQVWFWIPSSSPQSPARAPRPVLPARAPRPVLPTSGLILPKVGSHGWKWGCHRCSVLPCGWGRGRAHLGQLWPLVSPRARRGRGRWSQLSCLGTNPGLGPPPTPPAPLTCEARSVGTTGWGPGWTGWDCPWFSPERDRGLAPGVMWGQTTNTPLSCDPPDPV